MPDLSTAGSSPLRRAIRWAVVLVWCAVIYAASDRPDLRVSDDDVVDLVLRKAAHLVVFGVLAVLLARALSPDRSGGSRTLVLAWLGTLAWAVSDEWHQTFVDGRVGHASDVAIDMLGATLALLARHRLPHRERRRRTPTGAPPP